VAYLPRARTRQGMLRPFPVVKGHAKQY
jgi:hypothetical protein